MKKLTTFLLSICFLFLFSVVSFASTEESTETITTTEENVQTIDAEEENVQTFNTRIPDGQYTIESTHVPNHFVYAYSELGANVIIKSNREVQALKWNIVFDEKYNAYKIKLHNTNLVLAWNSSKGNNVILYTDLANSGDQFWRFKDLGNGQYGIFSAYNTNKYLNLDANKQNISVSNNNGLTQQSFKLTNVEIKPGYYTLESVQNPGLYVSTRKNFLPNDAFLTTTPTHLRVYYRENKDAYLLLIRDTSFALTWEQKTGDYRNVGFPLHQQLDKGHWYVAPAGNGSFYLRNYDDPRYFLTVASDGKNLIVSEARHDSSQQFRFTSVS